MNNFFSNYTNALRVSNYVLNHLKRQLRYFEEFGIYLTWDIIDFYELTFYYADIQLFIKVYN